MKITKDQVVNVAKLARINMHEEDIKGFAAQIGNILEYVETLNQIDTSGVEPTSHAVSLTNAFREDIPGQSLSVDEALLNAPEKEDGFFLTPRVIE